MASESDVRADAECIRRYLAGEREALEPLVTRYRQRVWRLAFQLLRDRDEAWDCTQDVFLRLAHGLAAFRGQSAVYTWLFRITTNVATDRLRARLAQARALGERVPDEDWQRTMPAPGPGPDLTAAQAEQRARIERALSALPLNARTILLLSDIDGLSYRELAAALDCPMGTVMSRLHHARKHLKRLLESQA